MKITFKYGKKCDGENLNVPPDTIGVNWRISRDRAIECIKFLQNKIEVGK